MSESSTSILEIQGLRFGYPGGEEVLRGVDLNVSSGRVVSVLGPNGSGKTTLLKCMLRRLTPLHGSIELNGRRLGSYSYKSLARSLAYVPQSTDSAYAFPVRELVLMGRFAHGGVLGLAGKGDVQVAEDAMRLTDTLHLAGRLLSELSGGESQRVMIARALAQQPDVMLLDEPTSHLDLKHQLRIHALLEHLASETGMAIVCVSHDINLAARFSDTLVLMRDGEVVASGSPRDVVTEEIIRRTYDVAVRLIDDSELPVPLVVADERF